MSKLMTKDIINQRFCDIFMPRILIAGEV